ncbi:MAG: phosphoribosylglycinamide formyltransferase [Candidatus Aminicenantes bacterium]|nr:MAG: phosphoribosylglycinamide formyltransferase [Candidatus Aminicenantes bacterium]
MKKKGRVAVLLSGRGSNFEAIYRNSLKPDANFEVKAVISDKKDARGLQRARDFGLNAFHVSPKKLKPKEVYEGKILEILKAHHVELICLAGYMRIVGETLLSAYEGRIMNIHPALLPSFPGLDGQKQALDHGVKVSGCTVHFVDAGVDTGPIILQKPVEVKEDDTEASLSQRILTEEHKLFSKAITLFFENRLKIQGRKVIISI